jgi:hypothetical protein
MRLLEERSSVDLVSSRQRREKEHDHRWGWVETLRGSHWRAAEREEGEVEEDGIVSFAILQMMGWGCRSR